MARNRIKDLSGSFLEGGASSPTGYVSPLAYVNADKLPLATLLQRNNISANLSNGKFGMFKTAFLELPDRFRVLIEEVGESPETHGVAAYVIGLGHSHYRDWPRAMMLDLSCLQFVEHILTALSINKDEVAKVCLDENWYNAILDGMTSGSL